MTPKEAIKILEVAKAEVEWNYPLDYAVAIDTAIEALEKQIPKKVKNSGERIPFEWYCPTCGELLCDDGYKDTDIKYCDQCGQALDWENT